ncbi:MAG: hypothetical protein FWF36_04960 [Propionibacteriaceae bacterium]|nr:hypothetical protein [Propionibacteriaceae bacterium]
MAGFAERNDFAPEPYVQREGLDDATRMAIWNVLADEIWNPNDRKKLQDDRALNEMFGHIWVDEFQGAVDEEPYQGDIWLTVKKCLIEGLWFDALDLLEAVVGHYANYRSFWLLLHNGQHRGQAHPAPEELAGQLTKKLNAALEKHLVGWRFIGNELARLDSEIEVNAVTEAVGTSAAVAGARHSLQRALELLSDRQSPDYLNSVKESISAAEAAAQHVLGMRGTETLGDAIKLLEKQGRISAQLKATWESMYAATNAEPAVRHPGSPTGNVDQGFAKYMLVVCSAFVTFLIEEVGKPRSVGGSAPHA